VDRVVLDLGEQPLANGFVEPTELAAPEARHPLAIAVCTSCWLVQLTHDVEPATIFTDRYAYFSSVSTSWVAHARSYVDEMIDRLALDDTSLVVEIASNDGYLLRGFAELGIRVLGIDPAANTAAVAEECGVPTRVEFFGACTAQRMRDEGLRPDLVVANNVLAHVPDLDDFVRGLAILLDDGGALTMEFPHLLRMVEGCEFDTIYHEHYSYFSLIAARDVFARRGLEVVAVEELPTHGGSLRIHACAHGRAVPDPSVEGLVQRERDSGLDSVAAFDDFAARVAVVRSELRSFLESARAEGRLVAGYGAPAKGATLLNSCGVDAALLPFTVDRSPAKQGLLMPGCHVPIEAPERIVERRPDDVLVLPWNLIDEIVDEMRSVRTWGGRFVVPIPRPHVVA
jgi:SAM-dependent methyltransferase